MLQLTPQSRIFLAVQPGDFRKGIAGLAAWCRQPLSENPLGGALYVFRNRTGTTLKLLAYDGPGFWLCPKRLSQGRFPWGPPTAGPRVTLFAQELSLLLGTGNPARAQVAPRWRPVTYEGPRAASSFPGSHALGLANPSGRGSWTAPRESRAFPPACPQGAITRVRTRAMDALCSGAYNKKFLRWRLQRFNARSATLVSPGGLARSKIACAFANGSTST
jgi:transposase